VAGDLRVLLTGEGIDQSILRIRSGVLPRVEYIVVDVLVEIGKRAKGRLVDGHIGSRDRRSRMGCGQEMI
jgi:hypothetical protein